MTRSFLTVLGHYTLAGGLTAVTAQYFRKIVSMTRRFSTVLGHYTVDGGLTAVTGQYFRNIEIITHSFSTLLRHYTVEGGLTAVTGQYFRKIVKMTRIFWWFYRCNISVLQKDRDNDPQFFTAQWMVVYPLLQVSTSKRS